MDKKLLQILACPECKKEVRLHEYKLSLICGTCGLIFSIRDGIPVMLGEKVEEKALDFYNFPDDQRYGREEQGDVRELVEDLIKRYLKNFSGDVVVELGCGKGALQGCHPNYNGIDISHYALRRFLNTAKCIQADIEKIPLRDKSISFVFSIATLEHIPCPESCLEEINRILKPGGVALLYPSWFCRPWAAKGLHIKRFKELNLIGKLDKITVSVRNSLVFRAAYVIPRRIFLELSYWIRPRALPFKYRKLRPNLEEYLDADSDAFSSMDPHMAIMYYRSRGYEIISAKNFWERLLVRHVPVVVLKRCRSQIAKPRGSVCLQ